MYAGCPSPRRGVDRDGWKIELEDDSTFLPRSTYSWMIMGSEIFCLGQHRAISLVVGACLLSGSVIEISQSLQRMRITRGSEIFGYRDI